jgi:hypothetical protein
MADPDVRAYERQLARDGHDARAIAAALLRLQPSRFLLLADAGETFAAPVDPPWERYTALWQTASEADVSARWRPVLARSVATLEDLHGFVDDQTGSHVLWDLEAKRATWSFHARGAARGFRVDQLEQGWRDPPLGPILNPPPRGAERLFANYVCREFGAALRRECESVSLACRDDASAVLFAAEEIAWQAATSRAAAVEDARETARRIVSTYSGSSGTLVFDVRVSGPRAVLVRWTVEAPTPAPAARHRRSRSRRA